MGETLKSKGHRKLNLPGKGRACLLARGKEQKGAWIKRMRSRGKAAPSDSTTMFDLNWL